jgi:ribonuclease BN (tRNA processing enzyme)
VTPADTSDAVLERLVSDLRANPGAVLTLGKPGRGKSTLVAELLARLDALGLEPSLLAADPGQPALGPPACFSLSGPFALAFLGSTDPMAVRLTALGELLRLVRLFEHARRGRSLVIDACGLVASAIGREWALRQVEAAAASHVVLVEREGELEPLARLLAGRSGLALLRCQASDAAVSPGKTERRRRRGRAFTEWLANAVERELPLDGLPIVGAPERGVMSFDWPSRLVGLLDATGRTLAVGVAVGVAAGVAAGESVLVRVSPFEGEIAAIRVGDAVFDERAGTVERRLFAEAPAPPPGGSVFAIREKPVYAAPPFALRGDERSKRAPGFQVHLPNGIFGDPLVHVRPLRERDGILLDLGRASSLPTKLLHRIGLVLISHAHVDHFFGFDELLRALLGSPRSVTLVGPPGITQRVASRIDGYSWNLIEGDAAYGTPPRFLVRELRGDVLLETELVPGSAAAKRGERAAPRGLVHEAERFTVRAVPLTHRDITSLAYEIEERPRLAVRPDGLEARGLSPGPWLDALKHAIARGEPDTLVETGPGASVRAGDLAPHVLVERLGQRVVYVTDAADTPENRAKIAALARGADLFVCEATFSRADEARARETAHLPAFAAAELALAAGVGRLVPFHLSPRYEEVPEVIFRELLAIFPRVQVPRELGARIAGGETGAADPSSLLDA